MRLVTNYQPLYQGIELAFARATDEVVGQAKRNAPVGVSGGLRGSISATKTGNLSARVGSPLRYAMMREYGGTIRAVRKPFLKWRDPSTGRWYQKRSVVQRPGGPRQGYKPWLRPAGDRFPEFMNDHMPK